MIEPQLQRGQLAALLFHAHVHAAEQRCREPHQSGERYQEHIERVDEEQFADLRRRAECDGARGERGCREQREQAHRRVHLGGPRAAAPHREQERTEQRKSQN